MNTDNEEVEYKYLFRPCYHSKEWLIEIRNGEEFDLCVFIDAIKDISPKIIEATHEDLMHFLRTDDQTIKIETIIGKLEIDWNCWDDVFIFADSNKCIEEIDKRLNVHYKFKKGEVDIEKYK